MPTEDQRSAVGANRSGLKALADFSFSTHESAIKPGKVQKMIMTPKDYEALKQKQEENKAKAIVAAQAAAKKAAKKKKD